MTVEERARECAKEYERLVIERVGDSQRTSTWDTESIWVNTTVAALVAKYLRDQIEDCAKITDKYEQEEKAESHKFRLKQQPIPQATHAIMSVVCRRMGKDIRALTEPTEERKETDA